MRDVLCCSFVPPIFFSFLQEPSKNMEELAGDSFTEDQLMPRANSEASMDPEDISNPVNYLAKTPTN